MQHTQFKRRSSLIAEQILAKIRRGEYKTGHKLPPERVIAEQMGVSRPSVREAISALQIVGIVDSRPGDGTYVCDPVDSEGLRRQVVEVLENSESPLEILQARKAMEVGVARLAIEVADDRDIQKIHEIWAKKHEAGMRREYDKYLKYGKAFHLAIAQTTKNRVIEGLMKRLLTTMRQPLWLNMRRMYYTEDDARIEQMLELHGHIVQALEHRDKETITAALEEHFDIMIEQLYKPKETTTG